MGGDQCQWTLDRALADKQHLQISKEETLNPIKQDTKKGKLRFVRNCFPHKGYLWNYGAFPQVRHTDARPSARCRRPA